MSAFTPSEAVQALGEELRPSPLFPTRFPSRVAGSDASLTVTGRDFDVEFRRTDSQGFFSMIVDFRRLPFGALAQQINFTSRVQRDPVRRERIGRRRVWYGAGRHRLLLRLA